ncbi:hypothetical protein KJ996_06625 [Patescibacteria group bacterium]|nr:hypothetical protein [Patescibacteria group bacterium]
MGNWREYVRIWALRAKYSNYWMQVASIVGNEFENISKRFHGATITRITMHVVEGQRKEEGVRNVLIPNHVLKTHI